MSQALIETLAQRRSGIAVLGLGYTGWPLAIALSHQFKVVGFDTNAQRIDQLRHPSDPVSSVPGLGADLSLEISSSSAILSNCCCFIVAVPTPVTENNEPDLGHITSALNAVAAVLKKGDLVILESTVYPGCTEEFCMPLLEKQSGLVAGIDFGLGYSPERINPGDNVHTLATVTKLVAAVHPLWIDAVKFIYESIVSAGVFVCSSVKVAEAAKMTENVQRDVNIALMNQLAELYEHLQIPRGEVWQAAATKWNFLPFRPGLAGGHCISVDPYYLLHRASSLPFSPTLVAEARRVNEDVKTRIIDRIVDHLSKCSINNAKARILIKGVTFKANVADVRNSKIASVALALIGMGCRVEVSDPWADSAALQKEYGLTLILTEDSNYDVVVIAADHADYYLLEEDYFCERCHSESLVVDLPGMFRNKITQLKYWTL